jgi:hypothetical protein
MDIQRDGSLNLDVLGEKLRLWFTEKKWTVKTEKGPTSYVIQATKDSTLRMIFAACRALVVICRQEAGKTIVSVRQGNWTENILSNMAWFLETGGMNLAFTLWSLEVQREFQNYVKKILGEMHAQGAAGSD